jgi:hypothetical protein
MRYRTFDGFNGTLNLHKETAHLFSSALLEFPGQEPRDFAPVLNFHVPRAHQNLNMCVVFGHLAFLPGALLAPTGLAVRFQGCDHDLVGVL